jgi:hypothetical protein
MRHRYEQCGLQCAHFCWMSFWNIELDELI